MTLDSPQTIAKQVVERLHAAGFTAFWVGGCVRDFLLGRKSEDIDIATDATPEQVERLFQKTIPVGRKFGVVVVVERGHQFQIARFRAEADYRDGRRPERIEFANAQADAMRRDFTVNGLFYDPVSKEIHDWVAGQQDLRARVIRTIGPPRDRFGEDHLRMLRAVRFAARLDFTIDPATFAAIQTLAPKIKAISSERIRDELVKIFALPAAQAENIKPPDSQAGGIPDDQGVFLPLRVGGADGQRTGVKAGSLQVPNEGGLPSSIRQGDLTHVPAARGLVLLRDSGLLEQILPEVSATIDCAQSLDFHPEGSVFNHILRMLEQLPATNIDAEPAMAACLPWAVLLHDIAKPLTSELDPATGSIHFYGHERMGADMAEQILQRLRFPGKEINAIVTCVRNHMQFKDVQQMRKATLRRMMMRETFPLEMALHRLDCLGSNGNLEHYEFLRRETEAFGRMPALRPPLLTGDDLLAAGRPPGKRIGELLHAVREMQLAEQLPTREAALEWVSRQP